MRPGLCLWSSNCAEARSIRDFPNVHVSREKNKIEVKDIHFLLRYFNNTIALPAHRFNISETEFEISLTNNLDTVFPIVIRILMIWGRLALTIDEHLFIINLIFIRYSWPINIAFISVLYILYLINYWRLKFGIPLWNTLYKKYIKLKLNVLRRLKKAIYIK